MSSDDGWFKRWGRASPFGPWSYADVEEMMKEMEKEFMSMDLDRAIPREPSREDGTVSKRTGPIIHGYSVTVGPDGKPVVREFGNVRRGPTKEWKESISDTREPLVDVVEGGEDIKVIAELPGAKKEDIGLSVEGRTLRLSAVSPARKYLKELELPWPVDVEGSASTFKNGILEVTLRRKGNSKTRIRVD